MAKKTHGSYWFCIDYLALNNVSTKDHKVESLHSAQWFFCLELKVGYWQISLKDEDNPEVAFSTNSKWLYES